MSSDTGVKVLAIVLGFWLIMRSVNKDSTGRTLIDHILGQSGGANQALPPPNAGSSNIPAGAQTNPVPGATASRLDQGIDVTFRNTVLAPFTGKVLVSRQMDPGWGGGGYIAVQNTSNPSQVVYFAEGLNPIVQQGETVRAGQALATPGISSYNPGSPGVIEIGPANPANPAQPLAQVVSNPAQAVTNFYHWLLSLGGPKATSTSGAGHG